MAETKDGTIVSSPTVTSTKIDPSWTEKFSTDKAEKQFHALIQKFGSFAESLWAELPAVADREVALRHLVDAKDHAVKAKAEGDQKEAEAKAREDAEKNPPTTTPGSTVATSTPRSAYDNRDNRDNRDPKPESGKK